jgi:hypothetical protein
MGKYQETIEVARELLRDGADPEYRRGIVNLIADLYGREGVDISTRMDEVERDLAQS